VPAIDRTRIKQYSPRENMLNLTPAQMRRRWLALGIVYGIGRALNVDTA